MPNVPRAKHDEPMQKEPVYSVILPVYNEAGNLAQLVDEIKTALTPVAGERFEIVAVDDFSSDDSLNQLRQIEVNNPRLRIITHRINSGQSAALMSGLQAARGEVVITMDADGQNDPADMPALLNALTPGIDAVCGVRRKRRDTLVRRVSSRLANGFRNAVTGDQLVDAGCGFRAIRRNAVTELPAFNGIHRFLPTVLRYQGFRVIEVPIGHRPRIWGQSKYGIGNRMVRGMVDCLAMRWWKRRVIPAQRAMEPA
jgi:dolichol-phosphate mannosyltransferase